MPAAAIDPNQRVNLSKARLLIIDSNQHSVDLLGQMVKGLGFQDIVRCMSVAEAETSLRAETFDLVITEAQLADGDAFALTRAMRRDADHPNRCSPVIVVQGHVRPEDVASSRDAGANFVVLKPITPQVLLQRVLWVVRDKRSFVEAASYVGPDRRFKFEGPPIGSEGRRREDAAEPISLESGANMSQNEIDDFIRPQKVSL